MDNISYSFNEEKTMKTLDRLKNHLHKGRVYRRRELTQWSLSVDRHLKELLNQGALQKMSQGLYYYPKSVSFGEVPPKDEELVQAFLKSNDFLLTSYNYYNELGVGTTQLYNHKLVYNFKRHGDFNLGGKVFSFRLKHKFPKTLSKEFLLVDLLNNLNELAEDKEAVLEVFTKKYFSPATVMLQETVDEYAGERTKNLLRNQVNKKVLVHA